MYRIYKIKNYKEMIKEIKEDLNNWRAIPCLLIRRLYILKVPILLYCNFL